MIFINILDWYGTLKGQPEDGGQNNPGYSYLVKTTGLTAKHKVVMSRGVPTIECKVL